MTATLAHVRRTCTILPGNAGTTSIVERIEIKEESWPCDWREKLRSYGRRQRHGTPGDRNVFAEQGAKVIASDISAKGLDETMQGIDASLHGAILPVTGDVADSDAVRGWVEAGVKQFGSLNVLYNNAGIMPERRHLRHRNKRGDLRRG